MRLRPDGAVVAFAVPHDDVVFYARQPSLDSTRRGHKGFRQGLVALPAAFDAEAVDMSQQHLFARCEIADAQDVVGNLQIQLYGLFHFAVLRSLAVAGTAMCQLVHG